MPTRRSGSAGSGRPEDSSSVPRSGGRPDRGAGANEGAAVASGAPEQNCVVLDRGLFATDEDRARLQAIVASAASGPLVVHLHGGLVDEAEGRTIAARLGQVYGGGGGTPLFLLWKTGIRDVVEEAFAAVAREPLFARTLTRLLRHLVPDADGIAAAAATPPVVPIGGDVAEELQRTLAALHALPDGAVDAAVARWNEPGVRAALVADVASDPVVRQQLELVQSEVARPVGALVPAQSTAGTVLRESAHTLADPVFVAEVRGVRDESAPPGAAVAAVDWRVALARLFGGHVGVIAARTARRFRDGRDHGWHATLVEETAREFFVGNVGRRAWSIMKEDAVRAFDGDETSAGGSALVAALVGVARATPRRRVVLVAHSAGAIWVTELLSRLATALDAEGLPADALPLEVVFLAPAVRHDRFVERVVAGVKRPFAFRCFTMRDEAERADALLDAQPWIYPRSMLYLVSGLFEDDHGATPLLGLDRFLDGRHVVPVRDRPPVERVRTWLARPSRSWILTPTDPGAPAGIDSEATDHGDFDSCPRAMATLGAIVKDGLAPSPAADADAPARVALMAAERDRRRLHGDRALLFTGRQLLSYPTGGERTLARLLANQAGVAGLADVDASTSVDGILAGGAAAIVPALGVAVLALDTDAAQRLERRLGASMATADAADDEARVLVAPERVATLADDDRVFADGYVAGARGAFAALGDRVREHGADTVLAWTHDARVSRALELIGVPGSRFTGRDIGVCIVDTGIDAGHPDFVAPTFGSRRPPPVLASFVPGVAPDSRLAHGTHCAGLACGPALPTGGVRYGVAIDATLYVARVFDDDRTATEGAIIDALGWALAQGCAVASLSLVFRAPSPTSDAIFARVVRRAERAGMIVVAATGNDSDRRARPPLVQPVGSPARIAGVLAVGAVDNAPTPSLAVFSNGTAAAPPALVAPGVDAWSSMPRPTLTGPMSGTSMATPLVAGLAALHAEATGLRGRALADVLRRRVRPLPHIGPEGGAGLVLAP